MPNAKMPLKVDRHCQMQPASLRTKKTQEKTSLKPTTRRGAAMALALAAKLAAQNAVTPFPWERTVDPSSGETYYFNTETSDTSWDVPFEQAAMSTGMKLWARAGHKLWERAVDSATGETYYYNREVPRPYKRALLKPSLSCKAAAHPGRCRDFTRRVRASGRTAPSRKAAAVSLGPLGFEGAFGLVACTYGTFSFGAAGCASGFGAEAGFVGMAAGSAAEPDAAAASS